MLPLLNSKQAIKILVKDGTYSPCCEGRRGITNQSDLYWGCFIDNKNRPHRINIVLNGRNSSLNLIII
jgi:hypothetical protein